jgi:hypothetical protein
MGRGEKFQTCHLVYCAELPNTSLHPPAFGGGCDRSLGGKGCGGNCGVCRVK